MNHVEIVIDAFTQKKIADFVALVVNTNKKKYKERNQTDLSKIKKDIYIGKLAEYAVFNHYNNNLGFDSVTEPDITIYSAKNKSYDADIVAIHDSVEYKMHIKSQQINQADRFGLSWSFQKNDPLVFNPIPYDYIVPCLVLSDKRVRIYKPVKAKDIKGKYKKPKIERLQATKVVLYGKDIGIEL
jgi:hypothetical protein